MSVPSVTFRIGQGVSFWLGPDGLGQIEYLHRTRVSVLYKREGKLCRARVAAHSLAVWQDTRPPLLVTFNPFDRAIVRPASKTFEFDLAKSPATGRSKTQ
jgi:hypothetical protein